MSRHKHADAIHAWAEGEKIEVKDIDGLWRIIDLPNWYEDREYRIKPKTVKKEGWINVYASGSTGPMIHPTKDEAMRKSGADAVDTIFIEWEVEE